MAEWEDSEVMWEELRASDNFLKSLDFKTNWNHWMIEVGVWYNHK